LAKKVLSSDSEADQLRNEIQKELIELGKAHKIDWAILDQFIKDKEIHRGARILSKFED